MFFAIDLLIPQHGGRFSIAWVAATRGIQYVSKRDVAQCNIIQLCEEILTMIQSSSSRPRLRLSLSLAARLVNGVIKVYRRQVEISIDEMQAFFLQVRTPQVDSSISSAEPQPPRRRVPGRGRRGRGRIVELSQEPNALAVIPEAVMEEEDFLGPIIVDENELTRPALYQADSDLITIRRELPLHSRPDMGECFPLDVELPLIPGPPPPPHVLPRLSELIKGATPEKRPAADAPATPSKRRVLIPQMPRPEAAKEGEIQMVPDDSVQPEPLEISQEPEGPPQLEAQPAGASQPAGPSAVRPTRRNVRRHVAKIDIILRKRHTNINRCLPNARERMDLTEYEDSVPVALGEITESAKHANIYKILEFFMDESQPREAVEELATQLRGSSGKSASLFRTSSLTHTRRPGTSATPVVPSVSALPVGVESAVDLQPHQMVVQADIHVPVVPEEPIPQAPIQMEITEGVGVPDEPMIPIAKTPHIDINRPIHAPEQTIETVIPPVAEQRRVSPTATTSSEAKRLSTRDRRKRIRDIVKTWNVEQQGEITIEDVCVKPINRLNIARCFDDLLALSKMGYVKLENKPDSLELGFIKKGERIP